MAYLAFQDLGGAAAVRALASAPAPVVETGRLSQVEWAVVACARRDGRGSLRPASWSARLLRLVFGRPDPRLARHAAGGAAPDGGAGVA